MSMTLIQRTIRPGVLLKSLPRVLASSSLPSGFDFDGASRQTVGGRRWMSRRVVAEIDDRPIVEAPEQDVSSDAPKLLYESPMGRLITRLKRISITSCVISLVGLPVLVFLKNGGIVPPDVKQMGLGGFAFLSAGGSTLALHFVFGPYVLELYEVPKEVGEDQVQDTDSQAEFLYKATTRSVFGWQKELVFDPLTDITKYAGSRPFANFVAKGMTLYVHPELVDDATRSRLLHPETNKPLPPSTEETDEIF